MGIGTGENTMTIFVTGAAGYIGSHVCVELLNCGYDIVGVDDFSNSHPEAIERVKQITGKEMTLYKADVRDEAFVDGLFQRHDIGCVIHLAGLKAVAQSVSMPAAYYDNNLNTTLTLCRVMEKYGVKRMVFSSSATVYNGRNPMPLTEEAITGGCINPYGWTKYMNEQILRDMTVSDDGWSVMLLRYFNPIGAHESGMIGEDPSGVPNNIMPYIAQTAVGKREYLPLTGNDYDTPDGTGVRDYLHVVDLAKGHVAAVAYCMAHTGVETVNLGTGYGTSVMELIKTFEKVNGVTVPYQIKPRRPGDLAMCYTDPGKAGRLLGWHTEKNIADMCADTWRWQTGNPNGYSE